MPHTLCTSLLALLAVGAGASAQESIPLRLTATMHDATVRDLGDGAWEVRTTGTDPYVLTNSVTEAFDHAKLRVFSFEYRCPEGLDFVEVFVGLPWRNHVTPGIPAAPEWRPFAADLGTLPADAWNEAITEFRIDFGGKPDRVVEVRNIRLRTMTPEEETAERARLAEERRKLEAIQQSVERTLIAPSRLPEGESEIAARLGLRDGSGTTRIAIVGKQLDLAYQVQRMAAELPPPVELPPALVAGEGPSPKNHTLVRVLSSYGIPEVQFLAYPPEVTGGVHVRCLRLPSGETAILTAPLSDASIRDLRLFSRYGLPIGTVTVPDFLATPIRLTTGDFRPDEPGDEIAVACATALAGPNAVAIVRPHAPGPGGARTDFDSPGAGELSLATLRGEGGAGDRLILHVTGQPDVVALDPLTGEAETVRAGLPPEATQVSESAFPEAPLAGACTEPAFSHVTRVSGDGTCETVDVGARENLFWFSTDGFFGDIPEGRYVRHGNLGHIRTDFASPVSSDPDFTRSDPEYWAGDAYRAWTTQRLAAYDTDPPVCWEPCFTHRWFAAPGKQWMVPTDEETGLPRYVLLDRENRPGFYGEFGQTNAFVTGSYAPGLTAVEAMYTFPQRVFLRELVARFRHNPEHFVAVEPNHEMEINAESQDTHGDYNPQMVRGFCRYLLELYGGIEGTNRVFGTPWTPERFDAPRDLGRGPWDRYTADNPYYLAWMRYLNYVIYRVVAGTYREALLAGFPPEAIKCHQIPDNYAIASLTAFSKPAQRVTPIDWNLNAGVGYGFTRYGVWYQDPHNVVQGANSSGFDQIVAGEYQSLTPDAAQAHGQLAYMRDHGIQFIQAMTWPEGYNPGSNETLHEAISRIATEDKPRPGVTGGTGEVHAVRQGERAYDIVSLGTGPEHTGLLKSIGPDGTWEGSVYVVPFHAHVAVETVAREDSLSLSTAPRSFGPFAGIDAGNVIDVSFLASGRPGEVVAFRVTHHGVELPGLLTTMELTGEPRPYRFQLRVQIDTDDLTIEMGTGDPEKGTWSAQHAEIRDLLVTRQSERTTKVKRGILAGERHEGGVTFDVIEERP